ncbi:proton extrusion protein PcxA [Geminocystis sp. GBBB08]|uniref:proton extrusion protein PcxA n=1 Tax=Geminocystis sp. GBBB08 TaxID=2604140 RepID=UPI0027E370B5|nr:proton extrusion protein PcxA [Geminocystis sp. GBBB08]MBL1211088.1 proton extrusion protein PcxA [Geminocystis sp. GBBB08]
MLNRILRSTKRWIGNSSQNALEEAYQRALAIKQIEEEHFAGKKIKPQNCDYGDQVFAYFEGELRSHLRVINLKINQFKTSKSIHNFFENNHKQGYNSTEDNYTEELVLDRLNFIDNIVNKYNNYETSINVVQIKESNINNNGQALALNKSNLSSSQSINNSSNNTPSSKEKISGQTSVLPRSFMRTLDRIRQEIDPQEAQTERDVVNKFRKSRYKTTISVKFLLLLIIVPLLVHNIAKITLGKAFVDPYFVNHEQIVFINQDLQEEALMELKTFEESLSLKTMIGLIPHLSPEEKEEKIKIKAEELAEDYRHRSANAIKNIVADIFSFISFGLILFYSKSELSILKSFIDETVYGLSDSAKAFLIILFTDIFVGFHSPHGWEIILESITRHFGLPENREFNFLFIATFPVILDTVLKYWIFRYLNRISPSAVATYKNMNE